MFKIAKQIRISAKLDKSGFQKELNQLLKKGYDLNLNGGNFKSVVSEISKELNKLKSTLNNVNGNTFDNTARGVNKTKDAVKDLNSELTRMSSKNLSSTSIIADKNGLSEINKYKDGIAQTTSEVIRNGQVTKQVVTENISQFENLKAQLQNKLNIAKGNSFIDDSVLTNLQTKLNSINTNTPEKEFNELRNAINNLSSSDSGIVRLQSSITRLQERIANIKKNKIDVIDTNEINEIKQAENEVNNLKNMLSQLQGGDIIDGKKITSSINQATSSVRTLESEFRNVNTTASGLATTMKSIFSYALGGSAIYAVMNSMRDMVSTTIELDDAMRDLKRVSDETESTYSEFMKTANQTAINLGTTTSGAIEAVTTFKALGYSFKESSEYLSQMALVLSNVSDMSASDASSSLVSILKGFRLAASETTKVVDLLNEAGNKFALTTSDLTEGLRIGGASLALANNDLEEASSLIISGTEILRDSNMVANGLKTISMRIKGLADENGELAVGLEDTVKILTGVDLKDPNNEFRSTYDILKDIGEVWDGLSDLDKATLAEDIAGKNRANVFSAIMQNAKQLENAYNTLKDSAGSAEKEQEAYMDSLSGRINALKESFTAITMQMVNSDFLKDFISGLTTGVNAVSGFIDTFGAMPTTVTAVVGALTIFNSKFRESISTMVSFTPGLSEIQNKLKIFESNLVKQSERFKANISTIKEYNNSTTQMGPPIANAGQSLLGLNAKLVATQGMLLATKIATVALNVALSSVLSMGISLIISGLTTLADKMITTKSELKELNSEFASMTNVGDSDRLTYLIDQYSTINSTMKNMTEGTDEFAKAQSNLSSITEEICSIFPEASTSIDAETGSKKLNLAETEKLIEAEKSLYEAKANEVMSKNKISSVEDIKELADEYQKAMDKVNEYNDMMSDGEKSVYKGGQKTSLSGNLTKAREEAEEYQEQIESLLPALKKLEESNPRLKGGYDLLYEAFYGTNEQLEDLEENAENASTSTEVLGDTLEDINGDGIIDATDQMLKLAMATDEAKSAVENLADSFSGLQDGIELLKQMKEEYSEYGMLDTDTMTKVLNSGDNQLIALLGDEANFIENINSLLDEKSKAQDEVLKTAIAMAQAEVNGSQEVIDATNAEMTALENLMNAKNNATSNSAQQRANQESMLVSKNAENYNIDQSNYNNKENYKIKGSFDSANARISNEKAVTDGSAKNYSIDDKNHVLLTNSKIDANDSYTNVAIANAKTTTDQLNENYKKDAKNYSEYINSIIENIRARARAESALTGGSLGFKNESAEVMAKYQEYLKLLKEAENASKTVSSYVGSGGVSSTVGHGNVGNGSSSSGSSSSSTNKEIADIEVTCDWYLKLNNAIDDNNRLLEQNRNLQEHANGTDKIKLMKQEVELMKQQAQAKQNLINAYMGEVNPIKDFLRNQGFTIDSQNNLINSTDRLIALKQQANKLSGSEKEYAIAMIELIEKNIERFTELTNSTIPGLQGEIEELNNSIKDVYQDQLDLVADTEKEIYDVIEYYANKTKEAKVSAIEEQIDKLNELYDLEDREDNLAEKQNDLANIKNQMDLYENAQDSVGKAKYQELKAEYDELLKELNTTIRDNQKDSIVDSLEAQKENLEKEYEDLLDPSNINKIISDAMKNGYIQLGDEVLDLNSATTQYLAETTIGTQNLISANTELLNSYLSVKDILKDISTLNANLGNIGIDLNTVYSGMSRSNTGNSVSFGNITVQIQGSTNMNEQQVSNAIQQALVEFSNKLK